LNSCPVWLTSAAALVTGVAFAFFFAQLGEARAGFQAAEKTAGGRV